MIATPTTQNTKRTLHICDTNLDAYHIKNAIQRVASIGVEIEKNNNQYKILVDNSNFKTANLILYTSLRTLKSVNTYAKVEALEVPKKTAKRGFITIAVEFLDGLVNKGALERSVLS